MTQPDPSKPGRHAPRPKLDVTSAPVRALAPPPEFLAALSELEIACEPDEIEKLGLYLALLLEANQTQNLTAIRDVNEAWRRHILDSLTLLPLLSEFADGSRVIDVGTGGGLPGIPLASTLPNLRFTLLEATGKKCDFLRQGVARIGLANTEIVQGRAERIGHDRGARTDSRGTITHEGGHREEYDIVTARAVGRLALLAELTVPFCKIGGRVLLIKGGQAEEEVREAEKALHELKAVHIGTMETPTGRIVILEKRSATPRMYPRPDGEPARAPLGVGRSRDHEA